MVIYVDVLIFINTVVDFLLLSVTAALTHIKQKLWRKILASFASSIFSLYIFLPHIGIFADITVRLLSTVTAVLIAFGFGNIRRFLRVMSLLFGSTMLYAGAMAAVYMLSAPQKMSFENGIVYFDISPLMLIFLSCVFYAVITLFNMLTGREAPFAERCEVTLFLSGETVNVSAMVDSGHTLNDCFSESIVIIIDQATAEALLGEERTRYLISGDIGNISELGRRVKALPVNTVSGSKLLFGVRLDRATVHDGKKTYYLHKPIAALSESLKGDDYSAIIPTEALKV